MKPVPELPEMEIVARRLAAALPGQTIESVLTPGLNALKTFDPPLGALDGAAFTDVRRRGKLLLLEADTASHGPLTLLMHLMSAGRLMLYDKRGSLRDRTSRVLIRLPEDRELRLREFGTKQAAWVKLLTLDGLEAEPSLKTLGPEVWPDPPALGELLASPRPLHSLLRDQQVVAGIGRTWVDEILHAAKLSPFKRGDDLSEREAHGAAQGDGERDGAGARRLRGQGQAPAAGEVPEADPRARPSGRALPALRHRPRGRVLRGLRDVLLPALPDGGPDPEGPAPLPAAEVGTAPAARAR